MWDGFVYALNSSDGSLKWKTQSTSGKRFDANVTVAGNYLYAGCLDSSLYALNITNGSVAWKFSTGGPIYKNPLVINNTVYTGGLANSFYAVNATTGIQQWVYPYHFMMSSPSFYNGRVYCGGGSEAWALDITNGNILWHVPVSGPINIYNDRSGAAIVSDVLYGGSIDFNVYAYNINTGAKLWTAPTNNSIYSSPVVIDKTVYIGSTDGNIYAFDANSGTQIWKKITTGPVRGSACVSDDNGIVHYPVVSGHNN
jgi:outer membrane protein assembly factor BamB